MKIPVPDLSSRAVAFGGTGPEKVDRPGTSKATAAERKAAQEFEAIFLRKMLASMEKSNKVEGASMSGSADAYSSMVVGALADAVAAAGGIGLSQSILKSVENSKGIQHQVPTPADTTSESTPSIQGSEPATVQRPRKGR